MSGTFRHPEEPRGERRQNTKDLRHELTARSQFWGWVDFATALDTVAAAALREGYTPRALRQLMEHAASKHFGPRLHAVPPDPVSAKADQPEAGVVVPSSHDAGCPSEDDEYADSPTTGYRMQAGFHCSAIDRLAGR